MIRFGWMIFLIFFISGCSPWPAKPTTATTTMKYTTAGAVVKVKLYFPNADNSALPYEEREVSVKEGAILKAAIEALLVGPAREDLRKSIPEGTRLLGINLKDQMATVDFSKEFTATVGLGEILARASLVNTLTEVAGVERVRIWVEGNELIGPSGMPLGEMTRFALDEKGFPLPGTKVTLSLYYGLGDAAHMQEEKREAVLQNGASLERLALEELIKGPCIMSSKIP